MRSLNSGTTMMRPFGMFHERSGCPALLSEDIFCHVQSVVVNPAACWTATLSRVPCSLPSAACLIYSVCNFTSLNVNCIQRCCCVCRQALVRATTTSYPTWLFDVSALLLRAVFQLCCNSLSAPPLKDLIPLFSPKRRPPSKPEVPCRSDSYLWAKMARISGYALHLVTDQAWPPLRDPVVRLVAQPFISPDVLTRGSGVDANTLYHAAVGGAGVTPLVLRPTVVDSLELKMSKVSPEFIAEFLTYGRQQQLLHSPEYQRPPRGSIRQFKAASELILMMDLYEWLASVLTHMQNTEVSTLMHANSSTLAGAPERNQTKGEIQGAGTLGLC